MISDDKKSIIKSNAKKDEKSGVDDNIINEKINEKIIIVIFCALFNFFSKKKSQVEYLLLYIWVINQQLYIPLSYPRLPIDLYYLVL